MDKTLCSKSSIPSKRAKGDQSLPRFVARVPYLLPCRLTVSFLVSRSRVFPLGYLAKSPSSAVLLGRSRPLVFPMILGCIPRYPSFPLSMVWVIRNPCLLALGQPIVPCSVFQIGLRGLLGSPLWGGAPALPTFFRSPLLALRPPRILNWIVSSFLP